MIALTRTFRIFIAVLREIFDETAYKRYLARTNAKSSRQAYAAFWQERQSRHERRPRCC